MIKLAKTGLLSVALLATVVANASKIVTTNSSKNKVVNIALTEITEGETLSIIDTNGVRLYSETLEQNKAYTKNFDFSTLPLGIYFIETKETKQIAVTPIVVEENRVSILTDNIKRFRAPEIKIDETIARVMVRNFNEAPVSITVYDSDGYELKTDYSKSLLIYNAYNFERLGKGEYTISVTQGDYNFTEKIKF